MIMEQPDYEILPPEDEMPIAETMLEEKKESVALEKREAIPQAKLEMKIRIGNKMARGQEFIDFIVATSKAHGVKVSGKESGRSLVDSEYTFTFIGKEASLNEVADSINKQSGAYQEAAQKNINDLFNILKK